MSGEFGEQDTYEEEALAANPGHTEFLDLTNGKGGERRTADNSPINNNDEAAVNGDDVLAAAAAGIADEIDEELLPTSVRARSVTMDPNTPGKVVEAGQEHTGRWTKEEHEDFLSALAMYGKEWKKVAAKVKTRTVVQTRTHAQKYFQKLQKSIHEKGGNVTQVDMGTATEPKKMGAYPSQTAPIATTKKKRSAPAMPKQQKPSRRTSANTMSAAQVISTLSSAKPSSGPFVATASSTTMSVNAASPAPRHGFSINSAPSNNSTDKTFASPFAVGWKAAKDMKIKAPDPSDPRGRFPEPSPAATGKRKLAEIAAARMLAGVAGVDDGPPTPPPSAASSVAAGSGGGGGGGLNLKEAPPPPLFGGGVGGGLKKPLSLQIVNPETLGVSHKKKRREGEASPVTPWDGQLEALVSGKAQSDEDSNNGKATVDAKIQALMIGQAVTKIHPVNGPPTAYSRSVLHQAVCERDLNKIRTQLADPVQSTTLLHRADEAGYCPIHSACAILMPGAPTLAKNDLLQMLIDAGSDVSCLDKKGSTPLHWAARSGDRDAVLQLVEKNASMDAKNQQGETPLHWAMRAGFRGAEAVAVLLENGARPGILDQQFRRPIDVATDGFPDEEGTLAWFSVQEKQGKKISKEKKKVERLTACDRRDSRSNLLIRSAQSRTLVLHHPECLEHHPKAESDWEAPDRVRTIMRRVVPSSDPAGVVETSGIFPHEVTVSQEFERAKLDLLSRVHSTEYLSFVNQLSKDLERKLRETGTTSSNDSDQGLMGTPPHVVPFTPMVQRSMIKIDESSVKLGINSDTSFSAGSLRAARRAAGAVQHAVDCVLVGRNRNAFCVVRPPGHHAGINGLLEGGESCGFCIFNNVAAGALHAIADDKLLCDRCAIVDIDVHHGNGTEEIVRNCNDPSKLFFFSIHLYDNDKKKRGGNQYAYNFYPGTGDKDDLALNIINVPIVPLWKDAPAPPQPVKTHNTRNKARNSQDSTLGTNDDSSETSNPRLSSRASDGGTSEAGSSALNMPSPRQPSAVSGRLAYRQAIQSRLLPALRAFNPDLILISAGFDASKGDVGNARHERGRERMGLDLEPEDYAWTTRKVLEIADICCHGRVVSVLEGGYGRTPPGPPSVPPTGPNSGTASQGHQSLDRTIFAECAVRHLHAMIDPYNTEGRFAS